jgi:hypothetical protein
MRDESLVFSSTTEHKRAIMVVIAAATLLIAAFAGSAYVKRGASAGNNPDSLGREVTPSQQGRNERLETELITLQQTGFEPNELTRPQGAFILGVDNRSGLEAIELRFERASRERLTALHAPRRKISWREVVELPPGHYLLSEANHPEWTCNVTIVPR